LLNQLCVWQLTNKFTVYYILHLWDVKDTNLCYYLNLHQTILVIILKLILFDVNLKLYSFSTRIDFWAVDNYQFIHVIFVICLLVVILMIGNVMLLTKYTHVKQ